VRMPAGHLPSPPMEAARLFPEPAAGEPYTILIMTYSVERGWSRAKEHTTYTENCIAVLSTKQ
jgi:hypothetical protein